jgi:hypothetical protein
MADARFRDSIAWQKAMALIAEGLHGHWSLSQRGDLRPYEPVAAHFCFHRKQYRRGPGSLNNGRVRSLPGCGPGFGLGGADPTGSGLYVEVLEAEVLKALSTAEEIVRILNASIATKKARIAAAKNKQKS